MTFYNQLKKNISAKIEELLKEDTTGMSLDNLIQVVPTPSSHLERAPQTAYGYRLLFRQALSQINLGKFQILS